MSEMKLVLNVNKTQLVGSLDSLNHAQSLDVRRANLHVRYYVTAHS